MSFRPREIRAIDAPGAILRVFLDPPSPTNRDIVMHTRAYGHVIPAMQCTLAVACVLSIELRNSRRYGIPREYLQDHYMDTRSVPYAWLRMPRYIPLSIDPKQ